MEASQEGGPMDEHDPRPNETPGDPHAEYLARYGAPVPPPPPSFQYAAASPAPGRRRGPRLLAAGAALAVVAVAGVAGFALGRQDHQGAQTAGGGPAGGYSGQAPNMQPNQQSPYGNNDPFEGMPFTGPGIQGGGPSDSAQGGT